MNYNVVSDRVVQGSRFEREREYKNKEKSSGGVTAPKPAAVSSTFDAFRRMATGKEGRSLADKISDTNRPTWEQYKKENEEKLDMTGVDQKKMIQYRKELDANRDALLKKAATGSRTAAIADSDSDGGGGSGDSESSPDRWRHHKKDSHKSRKHSKSSKHRDRDRDRDRDRNKDRDRQSHSDRHRSDHREQKDRHRSRSRSREEKEK